MKKSIIKKSKNKYMDTLLKSIENVEVKLPEWFTKWAYDTFYPFIQITFKDVYKHIKIINYINNTHYT